MDVNLSDILRAHNTCATDYYDAIHERSGSPHMFWDSILNAWVVTGYEECTNLLTGGDLERARLSLPLSIAPRDIIEAINSIFGAQTMFNDGVEAKSRRRFWAQFLQAESRMHATLNAAGPDVAAIAATCLDECPDNRDIELFGELLQPYVSRVVCTRLGLDEADRLVLYPMILCYARFLDGKVTNGEEVANALRAIVAMFAVAKVPPCIAEHHALYGDCHALLSDYIMAIAAGHDSTAYLLGNALIYLHSTRDHGYGDATDASIMQRIVKEATRFDSPVQLIGRRACSDITLNGKVIRTGEKVFLHIGAANRDPRVFELPGVFDPNRHGPAHLAFGTGESRCPGMGLSTDEAVTFLTALVTRGMRVSIDEARIRWDHGLAGRGFRSLPAQVCIASHATR
ncbi:MAG TPA: cytochrome P450 [Candidatus Kapabacteria bacterium]|nr:cytochrome P450 [Candidatus Kapabacteria bacterium]